jgi:acyl carrier protein
MTQEVLEKVLSVVKGQFKRPKVEITENTNLITDLGGDSLDAMEIVMLLEDEFKIIIPEEKLEGIKNVGGLAKIVVEVLAK